MQVVDLHVFIHSLLLAADRYHCLVRRTIDKWWCRRRRLLLSCFLFWILVHVLFVLSDTRVCMRETVNLRVDWMLTNMKSISIFVLLFLENGYFGGDEMNMRDTSHFSIGLPFVTPGQAMRMWEWERSHLVFGIECETPYPRPNEIIGKQWNWMMFSHISANMSVVTISVPVNHPPILGKFRWHTDRPTDRPTDRLSFTRYSLICAPLVAFAADEYFCFLLFRGWDGSGAGDVIITSMWKCERNKMLRWAECWTHTDVPGERYLFVFFFLVLCRYISFCVSFCAIRAIMHISIYTSYST